MKYIFSITFLLSFCLIESYAQKYCGTPSPLKPLYLEAHDISRRAMTLPDVLKVYIHIVAHDDGSHADTDMDSLMMKYELMQEHYNPHGICFILGGIDQINNTDLDTQYVDLEESELLPYLKPDMMNIFIHDWLGDLGGTSGGYAYSIPNTYFSVWELAVVDPNAMPILTHEMGHCLGLFHTHETSLGYEKVDRIGSCKNCDATGDLLCDTPADPDLSLPGMMNGCNYILSLMDACLDLYVPDPMNFMAYSSGSCQTYFTTGQGIRAQAIIVLTPGINDAVAPLSITFNAIGGWFSGEHIWLAEETITLNSTDLSLTGPAELTLGAGVSVTVHPGTVFQPQDGFARLFVENVCQGD